MRSRTRDGCVTISFTFSQTRKSALYTRAATSWVFRSSSLPVRFCPCNSFPFPFSKAMHGRLSHVQRITQYPVNRSCMPDLTISWRWDTPLCQQHRNPFDTHPFRDALKDEPDNDHG